jgi:hypothetical protein
VLMAAPTSVDYSLRALVRPSASFRPDDVRKWRAGVTESACSTARSRSGATCSAYGLSMAGGQTEARSNPRELPTGLMRGVCRADG